jgi:hypothetical protein
MKYVIDDIVTSFTSKKSSHKSAWLRMQSCMLRDCGIDALPAFNHANLVLGNVWYVSTPMEFKGEAFNLFGGYTEEVKSRIARLLEFDLENIVALDVPIPDIERILRPRAEKTDFNFTDAEWKKITSMKSCEVVKHEVFVPEPDTVVLGDSHSISRYETNSLVLRHDGLTMHGLLKRGIKSYLPNYFVPHLVINAGNVDIRHHLMRQENPTASIQELIRELSLQLKQLHADRLIDTYEITEPYPIEYEGRRIPKSGYYKGTPFYGTQAQRSTIRKTWRVALDNTFEQVFHWPDAWYEYEPEYYANEYMEKPGSVHLSPEYYVWDLELNEVNEKLEIEYNA